MSNDTFHHKTYLLHDKPVVSHGITLDAGDVLRVFGGPFGDAVILGFNDAGDAKMARPYVYAHNVATTGPTPLVGTEIYTLNPNDLRRLLSERPRLQTKKVAS